MKTLAIITMSLAATALATAAAAADQPPAASKPCFQTRDMQNHTIADDHTLYVKVGMHDIWKIGMSGNCLAGAFPSDPLIIKTNAGGGQICHPLDLDLGVHSGGPGGFTNHCIVSSIAKMTPAEVAAIPKKKLP